MARRSAWPGRTRTHRRGAGAGGAAVRWAADRLWPDRRRAADQIHPVSGRRRLPECGGRNYFSWTAAEIPRRGQGRLPRAGHRLPDLWQSPAVVVGATTIVGVLLAPRLTRRVPAPIVGLAVGVAAYFLLAIGRPELLQPGHNHLVIGPVGGSVDSVLAGLSGPWAAIKGMSPADLGALIVPALTLSVLLSVDTLKTCVVVDALTRGRHNSNRVLMGQGAGNLASALIGGMPGAGTMGSTLVNL
ncbi:MAG: SulP family inorganic anion transporter [Opitutus sp.]|nr:SulP family inorganic anion transporter [Opitutus sp.]